MVGDGFLRWAVTGQNSVCGLVSKERLLVRQESCGRKFAKERVTSAAKRSDAKPIN